MSFGNRVFSILAISSLAVFAACGGGGSHTNPTPPPSGGFIPSDLNGTYVFSTIGVDAVNGGFLTTVGTFTANGSGGITGGTVDINDPGLSAAITNLPVTGGKYTISADGRGQITLNLNRNNQFSPTLGFAFVLTSKFHGAIAMFDSNGTGSGTLDMQGAATQAQIAGPFAFNLSGILLSNGNNLATVGSVSLDASGNITAASSVQDINDSGTFSPSLAVTGSVVLGSGGAPGTATLISTGTGALGTLTFDVYPVDATHLKFVETDGIAIMAGDVFTQQGAALPTTATTFVFTVAGGTTGPIAAGGLMPIDGQGTITGGLLDVNNSGVTSTPSSPLNFSGNYAASGTVGGRTLINVSGFSVASQFIAYPTTNAGLLLLESDSAGLIGGVAFAQQAGASLSASQGYAVGLSAANLSIGVEEDDIAEFTTTSNTLSGIIDFNDQGTLNFGQTLRGNFTLDSPATGRGQFTSNGFNGVFYAIDNSTALFVDLDNVLVGTGIFALQNATAQSALVPPHALILARPSAHTHHRP